MMARKLRPPSERAPPSPTSTLARSQLLLVDERPPIKPSGKRAQYLQTPPPSNAVAPDLQLPPLSTPPCPQLFNRVVRIDGEDAYEYWYVLTFIPDLQWCHLAPLQRRGEFEAPSASAGRTRWMLVPEEEGGEIDVSARRCHIMQAREMKKTKANADEEEWDILHESQA